VFEGDDARLKSRKDPGGIPPSIDIPRKVIAQFRVSPEIAEHSRPKPSYLPLVKITLTGCRQGSATLSMLLGSDKLLCRSECHIDHRPSSSPHPDATRYAVSSPSNCDGQRLMNQCDNGGGSRGLNTPMRCISISNAAGLSRWLVRVCAGPGRSGAALDALRPPTQAFGASPAAAGWTSKRLASRSPNATGRFALHSSPPLSVSADCDISLCSSVYLVRSVARLTIAFVCLPPFQVPFGHFVHCGTTEPSDIFVLELRDRSVSAIQVFGAYFLIFFAERNQKAADFCLVLCERLLFI